MDWILTVPLLMVELVAVLVLPKEESRGLLVKLAIAAFFMIALGYPGEIQTDLVQRTIWGTLSTIPFVYIMVVLWKQLSASLDRQPEAVKPLVRGARLLTLASWGFYPIAYMVPLLGSACPTGQASRPPGRLHHRRHHREGRPRRVHLLHRHGEDRERCQEWSQSLRGRS